MDAIKTFGGSERFVTDNKTTKTFLGQQYWAQFSPNTQVDLYDLVGNILFPQLNLSGVAIEAAQTSVGGAKFAVQTFYRNEEQRAETLQTIEWWIKQAERFAIDDFWPMNTASCKMCSFNSVCSRPPSQRERILNANFTRRHWNPLEER